MPDTEIVIDETALEVLSGFKENGDPVTTELTESEKVTALQALAYVLGKNFKAAETGEKDGKFSISFKVTWDRNSYPTDVSAVASCSKISKADINLSCKVPGQPEQPDLF
jgi:hypothetical protein